MLLVNRSILINIPGRVYQEENVSKKYAKNITM
jgi:hypothetical protein